MTEPAIWIRANVDTQPIPVITAPILTVTPDHAAGHRPRTPMTIPLPTLIAMPQPPAPVTVLTRNIPKPREAFGEWHHSPRADIWRSRHGRHQPTLIRLPMPLWVESVTWCVAAFAMAAIGVAIGFQAGIARMMP